MAYKLSANITMMFREVESLTQRIRQAKAAGFKHVEITVPYMEDAEVLANAFADTEMGCSLINSWPGMGTEAITVHPDRQEDFKEKMNISLKYAKACGTKKLHVVAGIRQPSVTEAVATETYVRNVQYAADVAAKEGITILLEAINPISFPGYFIDHPEKVMAMIEKVNRTNVKMQLDIFHLQMCVGNLTSNIKKYLPHTDYIQVSQVPDRSEPGFPGEIDYRYIFNMFTIEGYNGFIGLEYCPNGDTIEGLKWLTDFGISL